MTDWRAWMRLTTAGVLSLLLHLLLGAGLNVYGTGSAPVEPDARIEVRLAQRKPGPSRPAIEAPAEAPAPAAVVEQPVLTVAEAAVSLPSADSDNPVVLPPTEATEETTPPEPPMALPEAPLPDMPTLGLVEMPDLRFYPAGEVDQVAQPATPLALNYPLTLGRSQTDGMVVFLLRIDAEGLVVDMEILFSDPPGVFDRAATGPFVYARYAPAMKNGKPVRSEKRIEVMFGDYKRPELFGPPAPPVAK